MTAFVLRRLSMLLVVMFGVMTIVFFLIHFIPGDPVDIMMGDSATASDKQTMRRSMGLDRPVLTQYFHYVAGVFRGDLGMSLLDREPVLNLILERFPASAELMTGAMIVAIFLAFPLGTLAAVKHRGALDTAAMAVSLLGIAVPSFWLGPLLILLFSIQLDWLPVNERGGIQHLVLPALTLGTSLAALLSRMIRTSLLEVLGEDYIRTARSKGLNEQVVILKHALRNALLPIITIIGLQVGSLLSGAIITESIFDWPGMGTLLLQAIYSRNYPLVQGCILFIAMIYVVANLMADLAYAWADPRVRIP